MNIISKSILIATSNISAFDAIRETLQANYEIYLAIDKNKYRQLLKTKRYEFTFIDIDFLKPELGKKTDQNSYQKELSLFWKLYPTASLVVMSSQEKIHEAVKAVKAGANSYITYPINPEEVKYVIEYIYEEKIKQSELDYLRDHFWEKDALDIVRTNSALMKKVLAKVRSVAPTKTTVLLYGDTGTGKGVIAGLIHTHSNRKDNQFISVHCGAIPDTLLESELFGHEKGAFTGAIKRKLGKFEIAREGTIFLDEIGTISPAAQIKLLKVLQDRSFQRVGGDETIESNARVIAATNIDLNKMTDNGSFRKDLYYRLNVFPIEIPPLRDRKEDIPLLVESFLKRLNQFYLKEIYDIHPMVLESFQKYSWPGNIRELENLIERSYILETSSILTPESFPSELFAPDTQITQVQLNTSKTIAEIRRKGIENIERQYLKEILTRNRGRINQSAEDAGISTRQLHKLLTKYGIKKEDFK